MRIDEIVVTEKFDKIKGSIAALAIAGALLGGRLVKPQQETYKPDKQLTLVGRNAIQDLPEPIRKRLGDVNTIIFVRGVPKDGDRDAICQVAKGQRIIYVNPKYANEFINGAGDQLTAHELTHIIQGSASHSKEYPDTNSDRSKMYGFTTSPDAWKELLILRKKGDRMWNHSREEQAMIVQQRTAQEHILKNLDKNDLDSIKLVKQKISAYDMYINDYDSD